MKTYAAIALLLISTTVFGQEGRSAHYCVREKPSLAVTKIGESPTPVDASKRPHTITPRVTCVPLQKLQTGEFPETSFDVIVENFPQGTPLRLTLGNLEGEGPSMDCIAGSDNRLYQLHGKGQCSKIDFVTCARFPGEPIHVKVGSKYGAIKAVADFIPFPVEASDSSGRRVEAVLGSPTGSLWLIKLSGFAANEPFKFTSAQYDELVENEAAVNSNGEGIIMLATEVIGQESGEAVVTIACNDCKLEVRAPWDRKRYERD